MKWPQEGGVDDFFCGESGCRLEREGTRISFLRDLKTFEVECNWADILITEHYAPNCDPAVLIDRGATKAFGAHGIVLDPQHVTIRRVNDERPLRPWNVNAQSID